MEADNEANLQHLNKGHLGKIWDDGHHGMKRVPRQLVSVVATKVVVSVTCRSAVEALWLEL